MTDAGLMSDEADYRPRRETLPEAPPPGTGRRGARRRPVFGWRDLLIPLLCAVAVGLDALYLANSDLDSIVQDAVRPASVWRQTVDHLQISLL
ncbi:MAG: hypothetical protein ACRDO8_13195, partial [Nocardioidaceae bacterium]